MSQLHWALPPGTYLAAPPRGRDGSDASSEGAVLSVWVFLGGPRNSYEQTSYEFFWSPYQTCSKGFRMSFSL